MSEGETMSAPKSGLLVVPMVAVLMAIILWGLAVALPVWETLSDRGEWSVVRGILPAFIGWLGLFDRCPVWYANILLIPLCLTIFLGPRKGFWLSAVAFVIAASAYMMPAVYGDNETDVIVARKIGFYLWLGSFLIMALGHAVQAKRTERQSSVACWTTLVLMFLAVPGLEYKFPVGVSPLEETTKNPNDLKAMADILARHPSQSDKDRTLHWVILQDLDALPDRVKYPRIEQLIAAGANVNQADRDGTTPLMRAVERQSVPMVRLLVRAGANVNAHDWRGKTVLDIADEYRRPNCEQILTAAGAQRSSKK